VTAQLGLEHLQGQLVVVKMGDRALNQFCEAGSWKAVLKTSDSRQNFLKQLFGRAFGLLRQRRRLPGDRHALLPDRASRCLIVAAC
jgi:hypothetical protein